MDSIWMKGEDEVGGLLILSSVVGCSSSSVVTMMGDVLLFIVSSESGRDSGEGELGRVTMSRDEGEEQQDMMSTPGEEELSALLST